MTKFTLLSLILNMSLTKTNAHTLNINVDFGNNLPGNNGTSSEPANDIKGGNCEWNAVGDYPRHPPLILENSQVLLPKLTKKGRILSVGFGSKLTLVCPGTVIYNLNKTTAEGKCVGNKDVKVKCEDENMHLCNLGCTKKISETIRPIPGDPNPEDCGTGENKGHYTEIGFKIPSGFYSMIRVCFDRNLQTTRYSENIVQGANIDARYFNQNQNRPQFRKTKGFFNVSVLATYRNQLALLRDLLGKDVAKSIKKSKNYLDVGHMASAADFVTEAEQEATFNFINALPQWRSINEGNWKRVEESIRQLASGKSGSQTVRNLTVYSGGLGVLQLENENQKEVPIYLVRPGYNVFPVPAVTWKVVYDKIQNAAAAIVVINNPFIRKVPQPGELLCAEVKCSIFPWLISQDFMDTEKGYTYCCNARELNNICIGNQGLQNVNHLID